MTISARAGFAYREFTDPLARFRLTRWLYALCWTGTDRPSVVFDRATVWLVTEKVLLPGASALERLIARIRTRAARRLWRALARDVTREQRARLDALLVAGDGDRHSPLDRLRGIPKKSRGLLCQGADVKFGFVAKHRGLWPVRWLCEAIGVSHSGEGYYFNSSKNCIA